MLDTSPFLCVQTLQACDYPCQILILQRRKKNQTDHRGSLSLNLGITMFPNVSRRQTAQGTHSLHKENKLIALKQALLSNTTNYP